MATIVKLFVFTLQDKDNCLKKTFAKGLNTQYLYSSEEENLESSSDKGDYQVLPTLH